VSALCGEQAATAAFFRKHHQLQGKFTHRNDLSAAVTAMSIAPVSWSMLGTLQREQGLTTRSSYSPMAMRCQPSSAHAGGPSTMMLFVVLEPEALACDLRSGELECRLTRTCVYGRHATPRHALGAEAVHGDGRREARVEVVEGALVGQQEGEAVGEACRE